MSVKAVLFDTRSIQDYIYSGDRLKTNVGASYLVDRVFDDVLVGVLREEIYSPAKGFGPEAVDADGWLTPDFKKGSFKDDCQCRIAYIGGGNCLLLFPESAEEQQLKDVVTAFTERLLVTCPGLATGAAIGEIEFGTGDDFKKSFDTLHGALKQNQSRVFTNVHIPYTGLTLECSINGQAANYYDRHNAAVLGGPRFISQEVRAKAEAAADSAANLRRQLEEWFAGHGKEGALDGFDFPLELDQLGQTEGEDYIAIVHVDGNNMGQRFRDADNFNPLRNLVIQVKEKTWDSFARLIESILEEYREYGRDSYIDLHEGKDGAILLPIRPIILGGDDVTFVCPGKLAMTYTRRFMRYMMEPVPELAAKAQNAQPQGKKKKKGKNKGPQPFDGSIDCCGGIAILKTSYPFFRGYVLAEQACGAAKSESRNASGTSWLDFVILHGEQAPTLEQIRDQEYRGARGDMHFGPYRVYPEAEADKGDKDELNLDKLLECTVRMERKLPMNKIKELRDVLQHDEHDAVTYLEQLQNTLKLNQDRSDRFPIAIKGWDAYEETLWAPRKKGRGDGTPYVDAIEMMDFYRDFDSRKENDREGTEE